MRVLIADDHSIVRSGLKHLIGELAPDIDVIEATSFDQAHGLAAEGPKAWDLVVLDLRMPGYTGLDDLRRIVDGVAPVPVAIFSMFEGREEMRSALSTGVKAFIPKSTDDGLIVSILRLVLAGGHYVPPVLGGVGGEEPGEADEADGETLTAPVATAALPSLTRRQQEVLNLLAEGMSNMEISEKLGLNLSTVKSHVTGILKALGVDNRTQAVLALKNMSR